MANALPYVAPSLIPQAGVQTVPIRTTNIAPYAVWRRGDFLRLQTAGSLVYPNPNGTLATTTPTATPTIGTTSSSGAPAQHLVAFYTYLDGSGGESLPSQEFSLYAPVGFENTVTVPTAGAPSAAADFALYVGTVNGQEWQQVASTALGSAATVPYPLTNYNGANRAATNQSTNIIGLAADDFDVTYARLASGGDPGAGYSNRALFGNDETQPPSGSYEQYQGYYYSLSGLTFEINLVQAWNYGLLQTTAGLLYSASYNTFAADTSQSNKVLTIVGKASGLDNPNYESLGDVGDTGARVICRFNSGLLS